MGPCAMLCLALVSAADGTIPAKLELRGTHFVVYAVTAGEQVSMTISPRAVPKAQAVSPGYEIVDHRSRVVLRNSAVDQQVEVRYRAEADGLNALVLKARRAWCHVDPGDRPVMIRAADDRPLHHKGRKGPLYFLVPKRCRRFHISILCPDKREGATVRVLDPTGRVVFEETDWFHKVRRATIDAPPAHRGRVWAFCSDSAKRVGKPYGWDDVVIGLGRQVPPFVSTKPEWLLSVLRASGEASVDDIAEP